MGASVDMFFILSLSLSLSLSLCVFVLFSRVFFVSDVFSPRALMRILEKCRYK